MSTLADLIRKHEDITRRMVQLEAERDEVHREILAAGHAAGRGAAPARRAGRPRMSRREIVEVVRSTVDALRAAGGPLPRREIAARLGISPHAASYRLGQAVKAGFVEKVGGGHYRVANVVPIQPPPR